MVSTVRWSRIGRDGQACRDRTRADLRVFLGEVSVFVEDRSGGRPDLELYFV